MRRSDLAHDFNREAALGTVDPWGRLFPFASAIYVVTLDRLFPRLRGETDILYVGKSRNLSQRWKDYWQCTTPTERDFHETLVTLLAAGDTVRVFFSTRVTTPDELGAEEAALLHCYHVEHRELPPLNRAKAGSGTGSR